MICEFVRSEHMTSLFNISDNRLSSVSAAEAFVCFSLISIFLILIMNL